MPLLFLWSAGVQGEVELLAGYIAKLTAILFMRLTQIWGNTKIKGRDFVSFMYLWKKFWLYNLFCVIAKFIIHNRTKLCLIKNLQIT